MSRGVLIVRRSDNEMKRNAEIGAFYKVIRFASSKNMYYLPKILWVCLLREQKI